MAAALACANGTTAESAGIAAQRGDGPALYAARVLRTSRGIDLSTHTPRDVEQVDLPAFDQIIAMTPLVERHLRNEFDLPPKRTVTWSIPDPYGGTLADYRYCLEEIDAALERLDLT